MTLAVTWWRCLTDPVGRAESLEWVELANDLRQCGERPYRGDAQPGWSPATFRGDRRSSAGAERVFLLCLDYDQGATADELSERWGSFLGAVHTTRKSTEEAPRFRVILVLSRPVSAFEFAALWRRVAAEAGTVDEATKDPSRFWFVPGSATGTPLLWIDLVGEPLDVDSWLARTEPGERRPETPALDATRGGSGGDRYEPARSYIAKMPEAVSGQKGHSALWAVACKLVHGFGLSDADALSILKNDYNPRCSPEWSEKELAHKVDSARKTAGVLAAPVESRPWTPPKPWSRDDAPLEEPPAWALPPDEWSDPDPDGEDGPIVDPSDGVASDGDAPDADIEREAIEAEPEKPKPRFHVLSMIELLAPVVTAMRMAGPHQRTGVPTGIEDLDRAIGRYRPGLVTIMGAKRSFGKTSFSLVSIDAALAAKCGVLVFAVEDSIEMYGRRFMARRANLNAMMLRDMDQPFTEVQLTRATNALNTSEGDPFFISAIGMPVEDICAAIREIGPARKVKLVIVDYLQRIRARRHYPDRRLMLSGVAGDLVDAGKSINAHTMLLSQLRRTEHREPEVEDLKESGDLEDMADHILLGHREKTTNSDTRSLRVAKNKDGIDDLEPFPLTFDRLTASFTGSVDGGGYGGSHGNRAPAPHPYHEPVERDDDPGEGMFDDMLRR